MSFHLSEFMVNTLTRWSLLRYDEQIISVTSRFYTKDTIGEFLTYLTYIAAVGPFVSAIYHMVIIVSTALKEFQLSKINALVINKMSQRAEHGPGRF